MSVWTWFRSVISLPSGKGFHGGGQAIEVEVPVLSFPFLFGRAFIEAAAARSPARTITPDFPSFSEGLSLRRPLPRVHDSRWHFPSFLEGLSLRPTLVTRTSVTAPDFPSFWEGLSLRHRTWHLLPLIRRNFPSFSEGLSLRTH